MILEKQMSEYNLWILFLLWGGPGGRAPWSLPFKSGRGNRHNRV
jgi:hypothetical protein